MWSNNSLFLSVLPLVQCSIIQANSCYALCILSFDAYIPPGPAAALSRPSSLSQRNPGENGVVIGTVSLDEDPVLPVRLFINEFVKDRRIYNFVC